MRQSETREIDGMKFTVQQMGGKQAGRLFVRLSSYLFPAISQAAGALDKLDLKAGLSGAEVDVGAVGRGLSAAAKTLFERLTEDEYESLLQQLLETALVRSPKGGDVPLWPVFDDMTAGKVLTQVKLVAFALEVNYRDFLPALGGLKGLAAGAASKFVASNTSSQNGPAGA